MSTGEITNVDVAICTWNRSALLAQTFDSLSRVDVPPHVRLRVLIVDNNSTDRTPMLIQEFQNSPFGHKHEIVPLHEPRQGHTFSRNQAVKSANSDLMIWTDDDVIVATNWIAKYVHAANANPDVALWGSVIEPRFETPTPKWVSENWAILKGCFAHRDLGPQSVEFTACRLPYGANFAIRTEVQKQFLYDTELGRRGREVAGEDELDMMRRLLAAGHRGVWVPGAVVEHMIPAERATERYVYDYFAGQGRALVAREQPWHRNAKQMKRESVFEYLKYRAKRRFTKSTVWVSHLIRSALAQGQFESL